MKVFTGSGAIYGADGEPVEPASRNGPFSDDPPPFTYLGEHLPLSIDLDIGPGSLKPRFVAPHVAPARRDNRTQQAQSGLERENDGAECLCGLPPGLACECSL